MHDIKLVLTDLDGTLLPIAHYEVTDSVHRTVERLQEKGITIAAVTGRPYAHSEDIVKSLGIEGPCVFSGGSTVIDTRTDEIVWKQWLPKELTQQVMTVFKNYCSEVTWNTVVDAVPAEGLDVSTIDEDCEYVFGIFDQSVEDELTQAVKVIPDIDMHCFNGYHPVTRESVRAIQVTHHLATKHHGVEALRKMKHTPIENTLAIGDGHNDIALFRSAGVKVAMGNASDDLKTLADYIVATVDDDGWVEAMEKYVLQNKQHLMIK